MCGIAGVIDNRAPVSVDLLTALGKKLAHRGPDGQRTLLSQDRRVGLVHTRLAIIDTQSRSDQPFVSTDGRFAIVYNGEIFNFLELRKELAATGVVFHTQGDTEVILAAYAQWGVEMLQRLNGMWAFAIHDRQEDSVFFARDRFGIKPLLYAQSDNRFAFASEVAALLSISWVDKSIEPAVAQRLLFDPFGVEGTGYTMHRGISRMPAGHYGMLRNNRFMVQRWWVTAENLPTDIPTTLDDAGRAFRELFFDAVKLRMRSDVRIGTCLSGGFDSSAVVSAMAHIANAPNGHERESGDWRHAFIAGFSGHPHDETPQARIAATYAKVHPHYFDLGKDDGDALVDQVLHALDDVYISLPTAPWRIYQAVRSEGVRVTLDGHGADELIGGYRSGGHTIAFQLRNIIADAAGSGGIRRFASEAAKAAALYMGDANFLRGGSFRPPERLPNPAYEDRLPDHYSNFDRRLYAMFHASVLPTILRNFDRLSMAHGVEVRMPFMDWRLVTMAFALPGHMKSDATHSKLVARTAMKGLMPEAIRTDTRKVGFNSQMPAWMNGSLGRWADELLASANPEFDSLVDRSALRKRVAALTMQKRWDWTTVGRLWPYINLKWYMDKKC